MEQDNHPKPQATESTNAGKDHTHQEGVIHSAEKISGAEEVTLVPKKTAEQRKSSSHDEKHQTSSDSKGATAYFATYKQRRDRSQGEGAD
jgi:hypothetical protein